jgi:hypothetical protein
MDNKFNAIIKKINEDLPLHSMWDGFWVHSFKRGTLVISCSFDRIYYRQFDLVFKKVIFFNVPERWRDSNVDGDDLLRLASPEEFRRHHPDFDTKGHLIFAIDMHLEIINDIIHEINGEPQREIRRAWEPFTFFIVATHVYLNECTPEDNNPVPEYEDRLHSMSMKNRVK